MNCIRCEILRVKVRALYMFHVQRMSFYEVAVAIVGSTAYSGCYWMDGDRIMRSPTLQHFIDDVGIEVVKLNRT